MVPSSPRITRGDPVLAQASAQSALTGFLRFLMNAQAESRTYPVTVADFSCARTAHRTVATRTIPTTRNFIGVSLAFPKIYIFQYSVATTTPTAGGEVCFQADTGSARDVQDRVGVAGALLQFLDRLYRRQNH